MALKAYTLRKQSQHGCHSYTFKIPEVLPTTHPDAVPVFITETTEHSAGYPQRKAVYIPNSNAKYGSFTESEILVDGVEANAIDKARAFYKYLLNAGFKATT
jgi:hypothetical protein